MVNMWPFLSAPFDLLPGKIRSLASGLLQTTSIDSFGRSLSRLFSMLMLIQTDKRLINSVAGSSRPSCSRDELKEDLWESGLQCDWRLGSNPVLDLWRFYEIKLPFSFLKLSP